MAQSSHHDVEDNAKLMFGMLFSYVMGCSAVAFCISPPCRGTLKACCFHSHHSVLVLPRHTTTDVRVCVLCVCVRMESERDRARGRGRARARLHSGGTLAPSSVRLFMLTHANSSFALTSTACCLDRLAHGPPAMVQAESVLRQAFAALGRCRVPPLLHRIVQASGAFTFHTLSPFTLTLSTLAALRTTPLQ